MSDAECVKSDSESISQQLEQVVESEETKDSKQTQRKTLCEDL